MQTMIGVIGGSGVYQIDGLEGASWVTVKTPWGEPSDQVLVGRLGGLPMAFLPRHGRGHVHSPGSVPYRANIDALKRLGCTEVVAMSAVGSLRTDYRPGDFVLVDQYIDRTTGRDRSFFGQGCVAHVGFARPTCPRLTARCRTAALAARVRVHDAAVYLAIEGPQFSTLAESRLYRGWGADVIGMTGMPEARLAREAELCYASFSMVTDFDCWNAGQAAVDVSAIIETLADNAGRARALIAGLAGMADQSTADASRKPCPDGCDRALTYAMITTPGRHDPELLARLDAVAGRILKA
jgi:5'-methylthioadenosine phosphorylase